MATLILLVIDNIETVAQEHQNFDAASIVQSLETQLNSEKTELAPVWWDQHVGKTLRSVDTVPADIHTLIFLAINHSNNIKIASRDPLIQETLIMEADSDFDWTQYLNTAWNDKSEPVGNSLTVGAGRDRLSDHSLVGTGGVRRLTRYGGQLDISQRFGWQNTNSNFFLPDDQATGQFTLSYTHPLMRGSGRAYNNSIVFLARVDAEVAEQQFLATLQDELLEVVRGYWALYVERSVLAHQMRLFLKTQEIHETLKARLAIDTNRTQLITAASALASRRADLIRAMTAVTNAETRLRGMINAPELGTSDQLELIPSEMPTVDFYIPELSVEIQTAIQQRPEALGAIQEIKAASQRLGVAKHELLPLLNLVTQGYANGLRGDGDFGGAFGDQFSRGAPSYSIGFQYEMPIGNRAARARFCRRQQELARLQDEYQRALAAIQTEVDIAVREIRTAYLEIGAKSRSLLAAESEAITIKTRWSQMAEADGSGALNLESLLRAQERVTEAEREYVTSLVTYNLAIVNLKRSNGSLLQSEQVILGRSHQNGVEKIQLLTEESSLMHRQPSEVHPTPARLKLGSNSTPEQQIESNRVKAQPVVHSKFTDVKHAGNKSRDSRK